MKTWLFALLVAAAPQEDCEMAQKPVLYPGSVVSRNSQVRQAALQGGAYVAMDGRLARVLRTVDEMHCALVDNPMTANKATFVRLKNDDQADTTIGVLFAFAGIPAVSANVGVALYRMEHTGDARYTLRYVDGTFVVKTPGSPVVDYELTRPVKMERDQVYVLALVTDTVGASMTLSSAVTPAFSFSVGGYSSGVLLSTADITTTTGWPRQLSVSALSGAEVTPTLSPVIFGGAFPVGYASGFGY